MAITDIFSRRYEGVQIRDTWSDADKRFMVQAVSLLRNVLWDGSDFDKINEATANAYKEINDAVALELGVENLSASTWRTTTGTINTIPYPFVVKTYLTEAPSEGADIDRFVKDRLSVIEQAYKRKWGQVQKSNAGLQTELARAAAKDATRNPRISKAPPPPSTRFGRVDQGYAEKAVVAATKRLEAVAEQQRSTYFRDALNALNQKMNSDLENASIELNERLRQAGYPLHFHNGLLQLSTDDLVEEEIHEPFWDLVADPIFKSVDDQMLEALDARDRGDRLAPFHAVSALESVIKIISKQKGWTTGNEKGAANYIDNLISAKNGRFLDVWEGEMLKSMFGNVRNPFGHGPGEQQLPTLSHEQVEWTIDTAMSWCKTLIQRM